MMMQHAKLCIMLVGEAPTEELDEPAAE